MEKLVVLYFIDLTFGSVGQRSVSLLDLSKWCMVSKPTALLFMRDMEEKGLVTIHKISTLRGHGFVYKFTMTVSGKLWLDDNYASAYELYRIHVTHIIETIKRRKSGHDEHPMLSAKEKRQLAADQKGLFDE